LISSSGPPDPPISGLFVLRPREQDNPREKKLEHLPKGKCAHWLLYVRKKHTVPQSAPEAGSDRMAYKFYSQKPKPLSLATLPTAFRLRLPMLKHLTYSRIKLIVSDMPTDYQTPTSSMKINTKASICPSSIPVKRSKSETKTPTFALLLRNSG